MDTETQILATARHNIRMAVALRDTNYSEVARKAGLSRNAVSQFVGGQTSLSYANMIKVCQVLNVPIGLIHRPDAITLGTIRLHRALEALPDDQVQAALEAVRAAKG